MTPKTQEEIIEETAEERHERLIEEHESFWRIRTQISRMMLNPNILKPKEPPKPWYKRIFRTSK